MDGKEKRVKLTLKNISKSFYARKEIFEAVNNVSLDVYENEFLVILGPGQCGKSVLLNMITGLEKPTAGTVEFADRNESNVGFVFQKTAVFPWKTVMENVEFAQELQGVSREKPPRRLPRHGTVSETGACRLQAHSGEGDTEHHKP